MVNLENLMKIELHDIIHKKKAVVGSSNSNTVSSEETETLGTALLSISSRIRSPANSNWINREEPSDHHDLKAAEGRLGQRDGKAAESEDKIIKVKIIGSGRGQFSDSMLTAGLRSGREAWERERAAGPAKRTDNSIRKLIEEEADGERGRFPWSKHRDDSYFRLPCEDVHVADPKRTENNSHWNRLPEEIVYSILARLPLQYLAQYRAVCKRWDTIWCCPEFWQLHSQMWPEPSLDKVLLFSFRPWVPVMYQSSCGARELENSMTRSGLSCLCGKTKTALNRLFRRRGPEPNPKLHVFNPASNKLYRNRFCNMQLPALECYVGCHKVVATSGGLILRTSQVSRQMWSETSAELPLTDEIQRYNQLSLDQQLMVGNPLKENMWMSLPPRTARWKPDTVGMVTERKTKSYKVVLGSYFGTEVYDSRTKKWTHLDVWKVGRELLNVRSQPPLKQLSVVSCRGSLFYIGASANRGDPGGAVHSYDTEKDTWSAFNLPSMDDAYRRQYDWTVDGCTFEVHYSELQECGGRMFLVGYRRLYSAWQSLRTGLFVWERVGTDLVNGEWKEIGSPTGLTKFPFIRTRDGRVTKEGERFLAGAKPNDLLCYTLVHHANFFVYSISRNEWWSVYKSGCNQTMISNFIFPLSESSPVCVCYSILESMHLSSIRSQPRCTQKAKTEGDFEFLPHVHLVQMNSTCGKVAQIDPKENRRGYD